MDCHEAASYVSALYDGERVPREFADHIGGCETCRETLRSYSQMGAELRLMASQADEAVMPRAVLEKVRATERPGRFGFLKARMLVPRFAVIAAAVAFVTVSAGFMALRAQSQSRPLWFQFELVPREEQAADGHLRAAFVAKPGYEDQVGWMGPVYDANHQPVPGKTQFLGSHIAVTSIQDGRVELAIRARRADGPVCNRKFSPDDLKGHSLTYTPGQELEIPVEGGGTLILRGEIVDTQPRLAWGLPVEPKVGQLVLNQPVVIRDGKDAVANMQGGSTLAENGNAAIVRAKQLGRLTIALQQFAGAVQAQANWGKITFAVNGHDYTVYSASPICGGEQPHAVWVALGPDELGLDGASIGSAPPGTVLR